MKMLDDSSKELENVRKEWDELSKRYDMYFTTFEGTLDRYLKWRVVTECLPENRAARILDAGGGIGTLCDLSPGQLGVAEAKLRKHGLLEKVEIKEVDIAALPFPDESFDLVAAMHESGKNPEMALRLIRFESNHAHGAHSFGRVFGPGELRELFESNGKDIDAI